MDLETKEIIRNRIRASIGRIRLEKKKDRVQSLLAIHYADMDISSENIVTPNQLQIWHDLLLALNKVKRELQELK